MLVLSRKQQQQIKIGDQITVSILRVKGNTVRVGIEAPREVRVVRGELPKEGASDVSEAAVVIDVAAADASSGTTEASDDKGTPKVIAFRVKRAPEDGSEHVSAGHLPLGRIHDRFGSGPLKQLVASCSTLAK